MKTKDLTNVVLALAALSLPATAGTQIVSAKTTAPIADYEGGRGLLTIEGPSGMFINPTSGTLPQGAFTAQYCLLTPDNRTSPVMAHGAMAAYGVTDWFEVGAIFLAFNFDQTVNPRQDDLYGSGPLVRLRLLKDEGWIPQLSVGGYFRFGDIETYNAFVALYKRFEIKPDGFFQSVGFHAGLRETWKGKGTDAQDAPVGYFGLEFQLPYRFYLVGEVSTQDRDSGGNKTPYAFGVQWRAGGINISAAFTNPGFVRDPSLFFGVGSQFRF
jgi:hypothetical protein